MISVYEWQTAYMTQVSLMDGFPNLKGSVLIVTYGRSGSTLLQSMLQGLPGAKITGENHNAAEGLFRSCRRLQRSNKQWGQKQQPHNHPWYGADEIDLDSYKRSLGEAFIRSVIKPDDDVRWIGFKEIRYPKMKDDFEDYLDFFAEIFPNCHFVFNSREWSNVANSAFWRNRDPEEVKELVWRTDQQFREYSERHPENCVHVQYESVISDPSHLQPIYEMLGEEMDMEHYYSVLQCRLKH